MSDVTKRLYLDADVRTHRITSAAGIKIAAIKANIDIRLNVSFDAYDQRQFTNCYSQI